MVLPKHNLSGREGKQLILVESNLPYWEGKNPTPVHSSKPVPSKGMETEMNG
jgi:hypothetical protein